MEEGVSGDGDSPIPSSSDGVRCWKGAFRPYAKSPPATATAPAPAPAPAPAALRVVVKRPLLARLTKDIVETYTTCNPEFKYSEANNPKRFLTSPSVGVKNEGYDNVNSDLILSLNYVLINDFRQRYIVKDILGQGTFGQVAKCQVSETDNYVAVKIIKNQLAYYQQALVEVMILNMLNTKFDPEDKNHIVRVLDYFMHQSHLCITFEMLGSNLYELIRHNSFKGLPLTIIRDFSKQILRALVVMKEAGVIHCDLKPENILMSTRLNQPEVKIIDFGSACLENQTVYSYIQSRYYRSPEVLLGYPYTTAIDMWSFGCVVAELYLGLPLFPGASEYDLLKRMIDTLGEQPPDHMLRVAKNTNKFFKHVGGFHHLVEDDVSRRGRSSYQLLSIEECEARNTKKPVMGKQYFNFVKLNDIVKNYPYRKNLSDEEMSEENRSRLALMDFLRGLVEFDPVKRWSPMQAVQHPFVTGEPFICPYKPSPETPRIHMGQNVMVDHNPGGGHWFAAGLSPQVAKVNKGYMQNSSQYQMTPACHASSYGSLGSYGSYSEGLGLGGSCGSYGEGGLYGCHSSFLGHSGMSIHHPGMSVLGMSQDGGRWRNQHMPLGNGFGPSPAGGSVLCSMSLGASPSQYTPPNSQIQFSTGSPGKYSSPSSPARGSVTGIQGSPLAKGATSSHFHGRRNLGYSHGASFMQHQEDNLITQHFHGHKLDATMWSHLPDGNARGGHVTSPRSMQPANPMSQSWRPQKGGKGASAGLSVCLHHQDNNPLSITHDCQGNSSSEHLDKLESDSSPPDPGDWDPNYSDELLLQDLSVDVNHLTSGIVNGLHLGQPSNSFSQASGGTRYDHTSIRPRAESSSSASNRRTSMGMSLYPQSTPNIFHETNTSHASRPSANQPSVSHFVTHVLPQNLPSRFSQLQQQSTNRFQFGHDHSLVSRGQTATSGCSSTGPTHATARGAFTSSGMSLGKRR